MGYIPYIPQVGYIPSWQEGIAGRIAARDCVNQETWPNGAWWKLPVVVLCHVELSSLQPVLIKCFVFIKLFLEDR